MAKIPPNLEKLSSLDNLTPLYPEEKLNLEVNPKDLSTR